MHVNAPVFGRTWRQAQRIARVELALALAQPRWVAALAVVVCIPALYVLIYLSSLWDPNAHTQSLRVGLVNLDKGYAYREQHVNIGDELAAKLLQKKNFGYYPMDAIAQAREGVRQGDLAFAIIVPPDFSALALPGRTADEGRLEVFASAGNNYQTFQIAKKFAEDLDADLNQTLNEQRWKFVLTDKVGQNDLAALRLAIGKIHQGSQNLSTGLQEASKAGHKLQQGGGRLQEEVGKLATGAQQLGQYVRGLEASLPPSEDVRRIRIGADELAAAHQEVDKALGSLHAGSVKLVQGVEQFRQQQDSSFLGALRYGELVEPLQTGLVEMRDGLQRTQQGHKQISQASEQLREGVRSLAFGVRDLRGSLQQTIAKLPEANQITPLQTGMAELTKGQAQLDQGLRQLHEGSVFLSASTEWLVNKLPTEVRLLDGSPEGLAHSVASELRVISPVHHLGAAMVPNVIPIALWLGAGIAIFLIRSRHLSLFARPYTRTAKLLGKASVPAVVVTLQTLLLLVVLWAWFGLAPQGSWRLPLLMLTAALSFAMVLLLLVRLGGDAGKALAMLLLALQISSSGGVMPVELSGDFYAALSPWLPMTWLVRGLKAVIFDAYGGHWLLPWALTVLLGCCAAALATRLGRWHYRRSRLLRPALDL